MSTFSLTTGLWSSYNLKKIPSMIFIKANFPYHIFKRRAVLSKTALILINRKTKIMIEKISTENAAAPGGHYSQAICHGDLVYLSGILPVTKDGSHCDLDNFEEQAKQVLANADAILKAAGCSRDDVIKSTVYVADISQWPAFNKIYATFFGDHRPARCVVPVPELHHGFAVEVEIIAAKP